MCAIKAWLISSAYKKYEGAAPPKGRNVVSPEKSTWVAQCYPIKLLFVDQSSRTFSWNAGGIAVDHISFRFWISGVVKNRAEFRTFFSLSQILGGRPFKSDTHFTTPASRHVVWKMFCEDTPTSPEVIVANTLNVKPNLNFQD